MPITNDGYRTTDEGIFLYSLRDHDKMGLEKTLHDFLSAAAFAASYHVKEFYHVRF